MVVSRQSTVDGNIDTIPPDHFVHVPAGEQHIVTVAAAEPVLPVPADQHIVAFLAAHKITIHAPNDHIGPGAATQIGRPVRMDQQHIVAVAAEGVVIAPALGNAGIDPIVARPTDQEIATVSPEQAVVASPAEDRVIAILSPNDVVAVTPIVGFRDLAVLIGHIEFVVVFGPLKRIRAEQRVGDRHRIACSGRQVGVADLIDGPETQKPVVEP